jgi:predicted DNA repair protein MutK
MTLKQRAILQTAGIVTAILASSTIVAFGLKYMTAEQIINGFAILSIAALVYAVYGVVLSRLEYNDTVKRLVDTEAK